MTEKTKKTLLSTLDTKQQQLKKWQKFLESPKCLAKNEVIYWIEELEQDIAGIQLQLKQAD